MGKTGRKRATWPQGGENGASSNPSPPLRKGWLCFNFRPVSIASLCWDRPGATLPLSRRCFAPAAGNTISADTATPPRMARLQRAAGHALLRLAPSGDRSMPSTSGHLVVPGPFQSTAGQWGQPRLSLGLPGDQQPLPFSGSLPALPQLTAPRLPFHAVTMSPYPLPIRQHEMANTAHG